MTEIVGKLERTWVLPGLYITRVGRMADRLASVIVWTLLCYAASLAAVAMRLASRPVAERWHGRVARAWLRVMPALMGLRLTVNGRVPESPYFLVNNHISWIDFIAMNTICGARCVVMDEMRRTPILGRIIDGLKPVYVRRARECTPHVVAAMRAALEAGESLMMCPEGTISPGLRVRRFHAALLDAAVQTGRAVHYAALSYHTPPGTPPPSKTVLFGPDPYYTEPMSPEEQAAWGRPKSFLRHVAGLLAHPRVEFRVTFAPRPVMAADKVTLANELHRGVERLFTPLA